MSGERWHRFYRLTGTRPGARPVIEYVEVADQRELDRELARLREGIAVSAVRSERVSQQTFIRAVGRD